MHEYEQMEEFSQCVDCGAYAPSEDQVQHFDGCVRGESERWRRHYDAGFEEERRWSCRTS